MKEITANNNMNCKIIFFAEIVILLRHFLRKLSHCKKICNPNCHTATTFLAENVKLLSLAEIGTPQTFLACILHHVFLRIFSSMTISHKYFCEMSIANKRYYFKNCHTGINANFFCTLKTVFCKELFLVRHNSTNPLSD
jgi:hypothetical protein